MQVEGVFIVQTGNIEAGTGSLANNTRFNNTTVGTNEFHTLNGTGPDVGDGVNTVLILWDPAGNNNYFNCYIGCKNTN